MLIFVVVGEFGKMEDILEDTVNITGAVSCHNALTAVLRGVSYVPVNRLIGYGVNS